MELQRFFSECGEGTGEAIAERVEQMADIVFPQSPEDSQDEVGVSNPSLPNRRQCVRPVSDPPDFCERNCNLSV